MDNHGGKQTCTQILPSKPIQARLGMELMEHFAIAIPATWWPLGMLVLSVPIPRTDESCGFRANLALGYLRIFSWNPLKSVPLCWIDLGFGSVPLAAGQLSTSPGAHRAVAWLWSSERFFNDMFEIIWPLIPAWFWYLMQRRIALKHAIVHIYIYCEPGIAYPVMFQWLCLQWMLQWWRYTGNSFRMAVLCSGAAVGLEPKRPVWNTPLALDPRVSNYMWIYNRT